MFTLAIVTVFILGYAAIALEHTIKVDKAASALLTGVLVWTLFILGSDSVLHIDTTKTVQEILSQKDPLLKGLVEFLTGITTPIAGETPGYINHFVVHSLEHHLIEISEILFFLLGAMTIVELIDAHEGFELITDKITTRNRRKLLWIISIITFFFSAVLDNLTTAIVMCAVLGKIMKGKEDVWTFASFVILAANAGGAWSPIGDVTTIMLWIGGQIEAVNIIMNVFTPSLVCLLVPLIIKSISMKGEVKGAVAMANLEHMKNRTTPFEQKLVFSVGVGSLLFVPVFKTFTHLPPFMGILGGLSILWFLTEILHKSKNEERKSQLSVISVLRRIDTPGVLFFLGILIAVGCLQSTGILEQLAGFLQGLGNIYFINIAIGILSSIVDNVPLVAGAMGMYELGPEVAGISYPTNHTFWQFLAYCAGTGGSCLIIGSAAGVATMGILKIDFMWYLKKITLLAFLGYLAGAATYYLLFELLQLNY